MKIFHDLEKARHIVNPVVTVGSYDGVHKGHRVLLNEVIRVARQIGGESVVITFEPHPRSVVENGDGPDLLNTLQEKIFLLENVGIDNLVIIPFTVEFSRIGSAEFIRDTIIDSLGARRMVVGYNHRFGHNQQGDFTLLEKLEQENDFKVIRVPCQQVDNHKVSSSVIRREILNGDLDMANTMLGYPYFIIPETISEHNFVTNERKLLPPPGKYPVMFTDTGTFRNLINSVNYHSTGNQNQIIRCFLAVSHSGIHELQFTAGTELPGAGVVVFL